MNGFLSELRAVVNKQRRLARGLKNAGCATLMTEFVTEFEAVIARHEQSGPVAKTLDEWHEDFGDALWWRFPIDEPPYCGSPLWDDWPGYHTHWTEIPVPSEEP